MQHLVWKPHLFGTLTLKLAILLAVRLVALKTEVCARHKRHIVVNLIVEAHIHTVVVVHRLRLTLLNLVILRRRSIVPTLCDALILGICLVKEVRAVELNLVVLAPRIRVLHTDRCYLSHTTLWAHHVATYTTTTTRASVTARTTTATTGNAKDILEREVLLVHVIEESDNR